MLRSNRKAGFAYFINAVLFRHQTYVNKLPEKERVYAEVQNDKSLGVSDFQNITTDKLRQVLFDIRAGNSKLAKSLSEKK